MTVTVYGIADDAALLAELLAKAPLVALPFGLRPAYIVCSEDRLVNPAWSKRVARDRLNAQLVEFPSSHSPFWSRPGELATVLDGLV